jgi:alkaline phosphatase D
VKPAIDLWSEHLLRSGSRRIDGLGEEQEAFLREAIPASNASWKVIGSSVSFSSLVLNLARDFATVDPRDPMVRSLISRLSALGEEAGDLARQTAALLSFPERTGSDRLALLEKLIALLLPNAYYLNCDHWDGFAAKKVQLLRELFIPNNCILIAGDIHSNYVSEFTSTADPGAKAVCLTVAGVSSETFQSFVASALARLWPFPSLGERAARCSERR